MKKKQLIFGLAVFCIVGLFIMRQFAKKTNLPQIGIQAVTKSAQQPIDKVENAKDLDRTKGNESQGDRLDKPKMEQLGNENKGLCRYYFVDQKPLLPTSVYLHLVHKKPNFLLLPGTAGACLSEGNLIFHIVDFDPVFDTAFNFYAKIPLALSQKNELSSDAQKNFLQKLDFKKFGFDSLSEALAYLKQLGYDLSSNLIEFKVRIDGDLQWPQSSSAPEFYPGQVLFQSSAISPLLSDSGNLFIATFDPSKDSEFLFAINFQFVDLNQQFIDLNFHPGHVVSFLDKKYANLFSKKNKIFIYQEYPGDARALAMTTYVHAKFKSAKVFLLSETYADRKKYKSITPFNVPDLEVIDEETLFRENRAPLLIDTRKNDFGEGSLRRSVSAPVYNLAANIKNFSDLTDYGTGFKFSRELVNFEINQLKTRYPWESLARVARNRKIILYGRDDADYSPLVFFESVRKEKTQKIYWLRSGLRRITQKIKLEVLSARALREKADFTLKEYEDKANVNTKNKTKKYILIRPKHKPVRTLDELIRK